MGSSAIVFPLIAVGVFLFGMWWGYRLGRAGAREQFDQALANERQLAKTREEAQVEKYSQMKADLDDAFKAAAADALRANTQSFLTLAKQELGGQTQEAKQTLEAKELAIKNLIDPLGATLKSLNEQTRAMEAARATAYGELKTLVDGFNQTIPASLNSLRSETSQLVSALREPRTKGDWGQEQLKRCVEFAGMVKYCSFHEQVAARNEDEDLLRPDMTIQLPNGRTIVVDAKTPSDVFSEANEADDAAAKKARLVAHAARVKKHLSDLSGKAYWKQFAHSPEFVVCFLPSEALFSAALEGDPELIKYGAQANVVMATPTTIIALLKAVAYGWQQSTITQRAEEIERIGKLLYGKLVNAHKYIRNLGSALGNAMGSYNTFIGTVEGKQGAFFYTRKLGEAVNSEEELKSLEHLAVEPRPLASGDWESASEPALAEDSEASRVEDES